MYSLLLTDLLHSAAAEQVETDPRKRNVKHKITDVNLKELLYGLKS